MSPPTRTSGAAYNDEPLHMTFEDNAMLPALFGRHDEYLVQIEHARRMPQACLRSLAL